MLNNFVLLFMTILVNRDLDDRFNETAITTCGGKLTVWRCKSLNYTPWRIFPSLSIWRIMNEL